MADPVVLKGWGELEKQLLGLSAKIAKNALSSGVSAGARFMQKAVKDKAPLLSGPTWGDHQPPGTLKRSIIVKYCPELSTQFKSTYKVTVRKGKRYRNQGKKGNRSQDAYYADWVEKGHWYVPPKPKNANWKSHREAAKSYTSSTAKFIPAHPFMRPAWEVNKTASLEVIKNQMTVKINEITKK